MGTPASPEGQPKGFELPANRRRYIGADEASTFTNQGVRVYEGSRGSQYIDAGASLHAERTKDLETVPTTYNGETMDMHEVSDHGPNVIEFANGEQALENDPTMKEKKISPKKDAQGNIVVVTQNRAHTLNGTGDVPINASNVKIAASKHDAVQAIYTVPDEKGVLKQKIILAVGEQERRDTERWDKNRKVKQALPQVLSNLKETPVEELRTSDQVILISSILGFRHGSSTERIHEDGDPTGLGIISLRREHVKIMTKDGEEAVHFTFRGKHDRPQSHICADKTIVAIVKNALKNTEGNDRLFKSSDTTNNKRIKVLTGVESATIKSLRTFRATQAAENYLERLGKRTNNLTSAKFKELQEEIGLEVGKILGHQKEVKTGENKAEWVDHGGEAIQSYIDPDVWKKININLQKGYKPKWAKTGLEERDIDEWAEAREKKGEDRQWGYRRLPGRPPKGADKNLVKSVTWMEALLDKGFTSPLIKEVSPDGKKMWFIQNNQDYVADLSIIGQVFVEKATFASPTVSYAPSQTNRKRLERKNVQGEPYTGDVIEEGEDI